MSYARMGRESDLYIFMSSNYLVCMGCRLLSIDAPLEMDGASFYAKSTQEMVDHVVSHREFGDLVPEGIEESLLKDDSENFPG